MVYPTDMTASSRHRALLLCENTTWRSTTVNVLSEHNMQCFAPRDISNLAEIKQSLSNMSYVFWIMDSILSDYADLLDSLFDHWPDAEHVIVMCQRNSADLQVHCKRTLVAKVAHCYLTGPQDLSEATQKVLYEFFPEFERHSAPTPSAVYPPRIAPTTSPQPSLQPQAFNPVNTNPKSRTDHYSENKSHRPTSNPKSISERIRANLQRDKLIVVASSTGGVQALSELLTHWPEKLTCPVVIAHHLPARFQSSLGEILQRASNRPVHFVTEAMELTKAVYISPFDFHVRVVRKNTKLWVEPHQGPKEHFLRPAADPLFRSAGDLEHTGVMAVVLTGMGRDGMAGAQYIYENGGRILCQDERSSVVWGMPKQVFDLGITEGAYHPSVIGDKILELFSTV